MSKHQIKKDHSWWYFSLPILLVLIGYRILTGSSITRDAVSSVKRSAGGSNSVLKVSNKKINEVKDALGAAEGAYFVPVVRDIPLKDLNKYKNKGLNVYGVSWLLKQINAPFTESEYFNYLENTIAPLLVQKGL